jgi:xanthine dehydrogenase accessory factor
MNEWLSALADCNKRASACVLVTVAQAKGSTPREAGAKMLVTPEGCVGTIGGGQLEYKAIEIASELLSGEGETRASVRRFPLGPSLGQCCGGMAVLFFEKISGSPHWLDRLIELQRSGQPAVLISGGAGKLIVTDAACYGQLGDPHLEQQAAAPARELLTTGEAQLRTLGSSVLLFEPVRPSDFHIVLFGAGHVGKALVHVLSGLPCTITWVDSREDQFPTQPPVNVKIELSEEPEDAVDEAPPGSFFLVMTHSHPLDQALCERILRRGDFRYCGLIGSATKRRKFEKRWLAQGMAPDTFAQLTCPIGIPGISGKQPLEIAIAVAAQLLQVRECTSRQSSGVRAVEEAQ